MDVRFDSTNKVNYPNSELQQFVRTKTDALPVNLSNKVEEIYSLKKEPRTEDISEVVDNFEEGFEKLKEMFTGELSFELDKEAEIVVVKILDKDGEIIKQIPSEAVVKLAKNLNEMLSILFDETA